MSAVGPAREVPYLAGGPEAMFRIGDVGGTAARATGTMGTGPWVRDGAGTPAPGALGVLVDVVWGGAAVACAADGFWGVTTELSVSFGAPLPADGSRLRATGSVAHRDAHAALTTGTVTTADGRVVATGMQRTRFVSGIPESHAPSISRAGAPLAGDVGRLIGLRGAAGTPALSVTEAVANPAGNVHGGILFAACELAAAEAIGARDAGLAAELVSILYLRPARVGGEIRCEAEVVRRGVTAATAIVRCIGLDDRPRALATLQYGPVAAPNG